MFEVVLLKSRKGINNEEGNSVVYVIEMMFVV